MAILPKKYSGPALALCGAVLLSNLWRPLPWPIASTAFLCWFVLLAHRLGQFVVRGDDRLLRGYFGAISTYVSLGLLLCAAYFVYRLTPLTIAIVVGALTLATFALRPDQARRPAEEEPWPRLGYWLAATVIFGDAGILGLACLVRTGDALRSPWLVLPAAVFIIFAISTAALAAFATTTRSRWTLVLSSAHLFTAFSISAIVYAVGFGFDPFIHRAAESALLRDGTIEPKQILYAGQYVLVAALARLTSLPLKLIDIWLVPILAALALPSAAYLGLKRGLDADETTALVGSSLLLVIPFLPLGFTVPFNLTAALFLALAFLLPLAGADRRRDALFLAFALLILLTHPLLGAPAILLSLLFILWRRFPRKNSRTVLALIFIFGFALALPALFAFNNLQQGEPPFIWQNPWSRLEYFLGLFRDPYTHDLFPIPWTWELLYGYRTFIPPILTAVAIGLVALRKNLRDRLGPVLIYFAGTLAALFLISTAFVFKDIIAYEQTEFASRLLQISYFLALPALAASVLPYLISRKLHPSTGSVALAAYGLAATLSWYFSYPQSNPKAFFSGPSVSRADVDAVREIETLAAGRPHIVLSNQTMAAAALQEFGFARYLKTSEGSVLWYPIPTGGSLYPFFIALNVAPSKNSAREAAAFAGVGTVFYAVHGYWPYASQIRQEAQKTADDIRVIRNSDIIIYSYTFH